MKTNASTQTHDHAAPATAQPESTMKSTMHTVCECVITCLGDTERELRIQYCPTHDSAAKMLALLRRFASIPCAAYPNNPCDDCLTCLAHDLLAEIEGA
jgi:hypothetical protein